MLNDKDICIEVISIKDLTEDLIAKYFPMLSEKKQEDIKLMTSVHERCVLLSAEIVSRNAIAKLNDVSPERLNISVNPNGQSLVEKGKGYLSVSVCGDIVCAAATKLPSGIGTARITPFTFAQAQSELSDSEIRSVVSASGYSIMDIVNASSCSKPAATELYAKLCAMKNARLACMANKSKKDSKKISFSQTENNFVCSDINYTVDYCEINKNNNIAIAVVRKDNV